LKGREEEEEDVNSYWKTLRKIGNTEICNRKHQIAFRGELAVDNAIYLPLDKLRSEGKDSFLFQLKTKDT